MSKWLADLISAAIRSRFTGYIQINFFQGGIANINKMENIQLPKELAAS